MVGVGLDGAGLDVAGLDGAELDGARTRPTRSGLRNGTQSIARPARG